MSTETRAPVCEAEWKARAVKAEGAIAMLLAECTSYQRRMEKAEAEVARLRDDGAVLLRRMRTTCRDHLDTALCEQLAALLESEAE